MDRIICNECGKKYSGYYIVRVRFDELGEYENLCHECSNKRMADLLGINLINLRKDSLTMEDIDGKEHFFKIRRQLFPQGIILEALEIKEDVPEGYSIAVDDELDCNQYDLEIKLYQKVQNELYTKYIESKEMFGEEFLSIKDDKVIGRIDYDETSEGETPLVVIGGKEYTWNQLGKMLTSYEGWQFKLEMFDFTEDVE